MKVIPLGLQCSVPDGINRANLREYSYPFDWLWSPSKTTYDILSILINDGIEKALEYMTTGYTYYRYLGNEHYMSVDYITESQMNKYTGLGNTHFTINNEYKNKLKIRLERLLNDIKSNENILFVYADSVSPQLNYHLDEIEYGIDATEYLLKIYELIYPVNNNIKIVYFCWNERKRENNMIEYISYDFTDDLHNISELIKNYLITFNWSFR
jgi:hypothetical protein